MADEPDEIVESARRALAEGRGLDAVFGAFEKAALSTLPLLQALRAVTGLGLPEAGQLLQAFQGGRPLGHVNQTVLELLRTIPHLGGGYGHFLRARFFDAVVAQNSWLTLTPGARDPALGSVAFWTREAPGEMDGSYGSLLGPGVDYDALRAELRQAITTDPFFQRHAIIIRDTPQVATYRFVGASPRTTQTSLLEIGDLLPPEEAYPSYARVEEGGALIVGHANGVVSIFEPPMGAGRLVVRSACASSVTAAARSASSRFVGVATTRGVTVVDLERACWAFRPIERAATLAVGDDGICEAFAEAALHRFDGMEPSLPAATTASSEPAVPDRGDFAVGSEDRVLTYGGVALAPAPPEASIVSARGVLVARRGSAPRWLAFQDCSSRPIDVGGETVGALALGDHFAAVGTWQQSVAVMSLDDGTLWRHRAIRKSDLTGDNLPPIALTRTGEAVIAQQVHGLQSLEALAWYGPRGRRARLKLPKSLERALGTLVDADADSALIHLEQRKGLWRFAKGDETQLVPDLGAEWVEAHYAREAFVLRTKEQGAVLAIGARVVRLCPESEDSRQPDLDRAAFSEDGAWLALRFKTDSPREMRISLWDVARVIEVARFPAPKIGGAVGWARPGCVDLAVDIRGNVISAIAPSVYGFFDREGARFREVCVLPEGEWIARTKTAWACSRDAFRWGALRLRGRVLDQAGAIAALGPAMPELPW